MIRPEGSRTEVINWRGGQMEFCRRKGCGFNNITPSDPPWYVVRYWGLSWGKGKWHYCQVAYGGPPEVFLTRKRAEHRAKAFRDKYGGGNQFGGGPLKVEVVKLQVVDIISREGKCKR